jgi:hypothetical protein
MITLTTIGSRDVTIRVQPSALPDAGDGEVAVWLGLREPVALVLTREQALQLAADLTAATRPEE